MMICPESPSMPLTGLLRMQIRRTTWPVWRTRSLEKYDGSPMMMGASATSASAPLPLRTPAAVPSGLTRISSTALFRMKMPP